jgi:UDP-glucuronate decarboxylase
MKVLVTGGAGFIGHLLCIRLMDGGHEVICMDNFFTSSQKTARHVESIGGAIVRHDVCDPFHIDCDLIYHLACPASPVHYQRNPVRTIKTAVMGTLNALECARDVGAKIVITSTSEVYGDPAVSPQPESYWGNVNPVGPRACYDEGKRCGEALAASWAQQYKTEVRIARLFNVYGPGMASDDGRLIPTFIRQALQGEPLTVYGDGSQTRSFCYVEDIVAALITLPFAGTRAPMVMNLGNPDERTVLSVAQKICRALDLPESIIFKPLPQDDPKQRLPDISLATEWLGWTPNTHFGEGLEHTIASMRHR